VLPRCASSLALNLNLRVKVIAFPITQKYALEASQSNTDTIFVEINNYGVHGFLLRINTKFRFISNQN